MKRQSVFQGAFGGATRYAPSKHDNVIPLLVNKSFDIVPSNENTASFGGRSTELQVPMPGGTNASLVYQDETVKHLVYPDEDDRLVPCIFTHCWGFYPKGAHVWARWYKNNWYAMTQGDVNIIGKALSWGSNSTNGETSEARIKIKVYDKVNLNGSFAVGEFFDEEKAAIITAASFEYYFETDFFPKENVTAWLSWTNGCWIAAGTCE